ncbi:hypothetical protein BU23DRAFT_153853 [Bimuria novae-zelandiae CBS 107.79]|uniref:Uncharacterized protein n=1 Tax=Bimuria novae-zelandiae CBS 107.79 TaxID=1447943 RepID=A0A6A5VPW4_9PLEO|nr:hypothetical protein BU23DRAFT_153853 [Bimuria novae-zelandiae CBS 107.79]
MACAERRRSPCWAKRARHPKPFLPSRPYEGQDDILQRFAEMSGNLMKRCRFGCPTNRSSTNRLLVQVASFDSWTNRSIFYAFDGDGTCITPSFSFFFFIFWKIEKKIENS